MQVTAILPALNDSVRTLMALVTIDRNSDPLKPAARRARPVFSTPEPGATRVPFRLTDTRHDDAGRALGSQRDLVAHCQPYVPIFRNTAVHVLKLAVESHDAQAVIALLAPNIVIRSPITTLIRFEGIDQA